MATKRNCIHIDRPIFSHGRCKSCSIVVYQKKAQEKSKEKKVVIKQKTDRKKSLDAIYSIIRPLFLKERPLCEANLPGCTKRATQVHHVKGRRGLLYIMSHYFRAHCGNCHRWVTDHSKEAKEMGISEPINTKTVNIFTKLEVELIEKYNIKVR